MELKRISILDGFRALAILPVIGFHYFSRWTPPLAETNLYPYGASYAAFPLFRYGYLGVEFFFVISGFVISMTLFASSNMRDFIMRRFARLWPTMILCSVLTFTIVKILPQHIFIAEAKNFLPSLLILDPYIFQKLFNIQFSWIDGAYWSLFVEIRFYFWAAVMYFIFREYFIEAFSLFSIIALIAVVVANHWISPLQTAVEFAFFPSYLPWFAMGVAFFYLYQGKKHPISHFVVFISLAVQLFRSVNRTGGESTAGSPWGECMAFFLFVILFYGLVYKPKYLSYLGLRSVSILGAASYSLYLLHQNIGVTLIMGISEYTLIPGEIIVFTVIALLITTSILIYTYYETASKRYLLKTFSKWTA